MRSAACLIGDDLAGGAQAAAAAAQEAGRAQGGDGGRGEGRLIDETEAVVEERAVVSGADNKSGERERRAEGEDLGAGPRAREGGGGGGGDGAARCGGCRLSPSPACSVADSRDGLGRGEEQGVRVQQPLGVDGMVKPARTAADQTKEGGADYQVGGNDVEDPWPRRVKLKLYRRFSLDSAE